MLLAVQVVALRAALVQMEIPILEMVVVQVHSTVTMVVMVVRVY
jgi:hypothetical protein